MYHGISVAHGCKEGWQSTLRSAQGEGGEIGLLGLIRLTGNGLWLSGGHVLRNFKCTWLTLCHVPRLPSIAPAGAKEGPYTSVLIRTGIARSIGFAQCAAPAKKKGLGQCTSPVLPEAREPFWATADHPAAARCRLAGRSTASAARTDGERGPRKIPQSPAACAAGTRAP